jgi:cobalamin biosynthesis Mg chelatase CobN
MWKGCVFFFLQKSERSDLARMLNARLLNAGCRLMEIESRLLPCGLHVVGQPPTANEAIATLVNIAEIDRPDLDPPVAGLPGIFARAIGRNIEEIYLNNNKVLPTVAPF